MNLKDRKVLIFGLGRLGGGVATAKWWAKTGVKLRITDLLTKKELNESINKLKDVKALYTLGQNRKEDIDWADIVAVNPGVSHKHPLIKYAREKGKRIENDCSMFFKLTPAVVAAVTGTRGKTTTSTWLHHFIKSVFPKTILGGNQPNKALLKILPQLTEDNIAVVEISSFQLEFCQGAPKLAIITNLLNDHLNRYTNLKTYAEIKANIFLKQTNEDFLILNKDNEWTKFYLELKPKSQIFFLSKKPLDKTEKGIYFSKNYLHIKLNWDSKQLFSVKDFVENLGEHNLYNLMASVLGAILLKIPIEKIKKQINFLPQVPLRQETIFQSKNLKVVNDSASTTPDAVIQALRRFTQRGLTLTNRRPAQIKYKNVCASQRKTRISPRLILITGGTDKNLDFKNLAKEIKLRLKPDNVIFINGSATRKLLNELKKIKFNYLKENVFENLKDCIQSALFLFRVNPRLVSVGPRLLLFSPGAASFEKFKNEFDRGKQFNAQIKKAFRL